MSSRKKRNLDRQLSFRASPDLVAAVDAYAERLADRGPEYPMSTAAALRGLVVRGLEEVKRADADEAKHAEARFGLPPHDEAAA